MRNDELKNEVLAKADLVRVISEHVQLKRQGPHWLGLCPFHVERTPSFVVSPSKGLYKCFGCGKSGDVIAFVMDFSGLKYGEALEKLAGYSNILIEDQRFKDSRSQAAPQPASPKLTVEKRILAATLKQYEKNTLYNFLKTRWPERLVAGAFMKLLTGTAKDGGAIFWQVDQFRRVRTAQKINYNPDGHRKKEVPPQRLYKVEEGYSPCLFGEHQLVHAEDNDLVCIVESEKTALVCSIALPELYGQPAYWLASHGTNGLTDEKIFCLKGRTVCLVPDFSYLARATWGLLPMKKKPNEKGHMIPAPDGILDDSFVSVSTKLNRLGCKVLFLNAAPHLDNGEDIADLLVSDKPAAAVAQAVGPVPDYPTGTATPPTGPEYYEPNYSGLKLDVLRPEVVPVGTKLLTGERSFKFSHADGLQLQGIREADRAKVEGLFSEFPNVRLLCERLRFREGSIKT